jgi:hypothetical protein
MSTELVSGEGVPTRPEWVKALKYWRFLVRPWEYFGDELGIFLALGGPGFGRTYLAIRHEPQVERLYRDRPDIRALLSDDTFLASLPSGSLGHAYRDFLRQHRLDTGVFNETDTVIPVAEHLGYGEDFTFLLKRGVVLHDIYHTLGGYGPDLGGEFGNIGFHYGQMTGGNGFLRAMGLMFTYLLPMGVRIRRQASPQHLRLANRAATGPASRPSTCPSQHHAQQPRPPQRPHLRPRAQAREEGQQ